MTKKIILFDGQWVLTENVHLLNYRGGKGGSLITAKPTDRRAILEEAS